MMAYFFIQNYYKGEYVMIMTHGFFKENVRYPVWTCRDPIFSDSRYPMIIFADYRDPIFKSRDPNRVHKIPLKNPDYDHQKVLSVIMTFTVLLRLATNDELCEVRMCYVCK